MSLPVVSRSGSSREPAIARRETARSGRLLRKGTASRPDTKQSTSDISYLRDKSPQLPVPETRIPKKYHRTKKSVAPPLNRTRGMSADSATRNGKEGLAALDAEYDDGEHLWITTMFPTKNPTSRQEVQDVEGLMMRLLKENQEEHDDPLEAVKGAQEIYNLVFHELIRQVWVQCADRGVLMERIWNRYLMLFEHILKMREHERGQYQKKIAENHRQFEKGNQDKDLKFSKMYLQLAAAKEQVSMKKDMLERNVLLLQEEYKRQLLREQHMKSALQELRKQHLKWEEMLAPHIVKQADGDDHLNIPEDATALKEELQTLLTLSQVDRELIDVLESSKVASPLIPSETFSEEPTILLQRLENMDQRLVDMEEHLRSAGVWSNEELEESSQFKKLLTALRSTLQTLEPMSKEHAAGQPAAAAAKGFNAELAALNQSDVGTQTDVAPSLMYNRASLLDPTRMIDVPSASDAKSQSSKSPRNLSSPNVTPNLGRRLSTPKGATSRGGTPSRAQRLLELESMPIRKGSDATFENQLDTLRFPGASQGEEAVLPTANRPSDDELISLMLTVDWLYVEHMSFVAEGGARDLRASLFGSFLALHGTTSAAMEALWEFLASVLSAVPFNLHLRMFVKFCGGTSDEKPYNSEDLAVFLYAWSQCKTMIHIGEQAASDGLPRRPTTKEAMIEEDDVRGLAVMIFGEEGHRLADVWMTGRGEEGIGVHALLEIVVNESHRRTVAWEAPILSALTSPNLSFTTFDEAVEEAFGLPASSLLAEPTESGERKRLKTFQLMYEGAAGTGQLNVETALSIMRDNFLLSHTREASEQVREAVYELAVGKFVEQEWMKLNKDDALMIRIEQMRENHSVKAISELRKACEATADAVGFSSSADSASKLEAFRVMSELLKKMDKTQM